MPEVCFWCLWAFKSIAVFCGWTIYYIVQKQCLKKWIGSALLREHNGITFNPLHRPWVP